MIRVTRRDAQRARGRGRGIRGSDAHEVPIRGAGREVQSARSGCRPVARRRRTSLFTAGYEGLSLSQFLKQLNAASVEVLFDIRYRPQSRKPGFSKNH